MPFVIGRGFAEVQILKKVNLALSLNHMEFFMNYCKDFEIDKIYHRGLPNTIYHW